VTRDGLDDRLWLGMSGETARPGGDLGATLTFGPDRLGVGGPRASGVAPDNGGAYVFPVPR
jgi:hypothetical protein